MPDATCKTCPWSSQFSAVDKEIEASRQHEYNLKFIIVTGESGRCRRNPPGRGNYYAVSEWPLVDLDHDWCGEHPDRQPRLECGMTTIVSHDDDGPSAADMRRIVDALEKIASRAARAKS